MRIGELIGRKPNEVQQQREDTKRLLGQVASLAPQINRDYYVSASLGSLFSAQFSEDDDVRTVAGSLELKDGDPLYVSWKNWNLTKNTRLFHIHNSGNGLRDFGINYDARTLAIKGVRINNIPFETIDQTFFVHLLRKIKEDLAANRKDWKNTLRQQRTEFGDKLGDIGEETAKAVNGVLGTFVFAFPQKQFSVFGVIEGREKDEDELQIRLFSTMPVDEDMARVIDMHLQSSHIDFSVKESSYVNRFGYVAHDVDPRKMVLRYPDFQITVENFYPASVLTPSQEISTQPEDDWNYILEAHFNSFLAGEKPTFYPVASGEKNATLLLKSTGSWLPTNGDLFDTVTIPSAPKSPGIA